MPAGTPYQRRQADIPDRPLSFYRPRPGFSVADSIDPAETFYIRMAPTPGLAFIAVNCQSGLSVACLEGSDLRNVRNPALRQGLAGTLFRPPALRGRRGARIPGHVSVFQTAPASFLVCACVDNRLDTSCCVTVRPFLRSLYPRHNQRLWSLRTFPHPAHHFSSTTSHKLGILVTVSPSSLPVGCCLPLPLSRSEGGRTTC